MARGNNDEDVSLRFKYGIQTVFLFVKANAPFSQIAQDLTNVLRERYPDGLAISEFNPDRTPIPSEDSDFDVAFGVPRNSKDLAQGWKHLDLEGSETPLTLGFKDNDVFAVAFQTSEQKGEEPTFVVQLPTNEDEDEDEQ